MLHSNAHIVSSHVLLSLDYEWRKCGLHELGNSSQIEQLVRTGQEVFALTYFFKHINISRVPSLFSEPLGSSRSDWNSQFLELDLGFQAWGILIHLQQHETGPTEEESHIRRWEGDTANRIPGAFNQAREGTVGSQGEPGRQVCRQPSEQAVSVKVNTARLAEASQWPTWVQAKIQTIWTAPLWSV